MKIRKLHIKNYKVFNDLELDFTDANGKTLDKIVLAGVNGCGKTTILEIIKKMYDGTLQSYFYNTKKGAIELEIELSDSEKRSVIQIIRSSVGKEELEDSDEYFEVLKLLNSTEKNFTLKYAPKIKSNSANIIFNNLRHGSLQLLYLPIKIHEDNLPKRTIDYQSFELIHLDADKDKMKSLILKKIRDEVFKNEDIAPRQTKEKAIKRITKALNGLALTTKLVDLESEELIFESANGEKIKFEDLSNGEQTLYFRAIYLSTLNPQNSIIMIDEPEDSLHPTWQQKVMKLYQNIGENNQVIVATHSPHIIGSSNAEEVFLLEIEGNQVEAVHPRYTKGHSIDYILDVMGTDPRDTTIIHKIDAYLALIRKGMQETAEGFKLKAEIDALNLDPNSVEMRRLDLSIKRFKAVGV